MHASLAPPVVSAITAGVLIVAQMALLFTVVATRRRVRQSLGEAGDPTLTRAVRRHGNFAENAAIFVTCLALLEMLGALRIFVAAMAALFVLGRILHAVGLSQTRTVNLWRVTGVFATVGAGVIVGVRLITVGVAWLH